MKLWIPVLLTAALSSCASSSCASSSDTRTVYLLGRFTAPLSKPELARSLALQGHVVVPRMAPGVDLVVVGSDPVSADGTRIVPVRDLPEYSLATQLGVEVLDRTVAEDRFHLGRE